MQPSPVKPTGAAMIGLAYLAVWLVCHQEPLCTYYLSTSFRRVDNLLELLRADVDYNENVMEAESVLEHVLRLCESLDLSDEFGRRRLFEVVRGWLVSAQVPASLTPSLLQLYFNLELNVVSIVASFPKSIFNQSSVDCWDMLCIVHFHLRDRLCLKFDVLY